MSKGTEFGQTYAKAIQSNSGKSYADRQFRTTAWKTYCDARDKYNKDKPNRIQKYQEEQAKLLETKEDRKKAKKEKNKDRRKQKSKDKELQQSVQDEPTQNVVNGVSDTDILKASDQV